MKFYSIICFKLDKYHSKYNLYEITGRGREKREHLEEFIIFLLENISTFRAAPNIRITPLNPIHSIVGLPHNGTEAHNARIGTHWRFFCLHPRFFNVSMQLVQLYWVFAGRFYQKNISVCSFNILISPGWLVWVDDPGWPPVCHHLQHCFPSLWSGMVCNV